MDGWNGRRWWEFCTSSFVKWVFWPRIGCCRNRSFFTSPDISIRVWFKVKPRGRDVCSPWSFSQPSSQLEQCLGCQWLLAPGKTLNVPFSYGNDMIEVMHTWSNSYDLVSEKRNVWYQSGRSWQPFGEGKIGHKSFRQVRVCYANASFLCEIANLQIRFSIICNVYHAIVHFLPKKHCFWPKKALFLPRISKTIA